MKNGIFSLLGRKALEIFKSKYLHLLIRHSLTAVSGALATFGAFLQSKLVDLGAQAGDASVINDAVAAASDKIQSDSTAAFAASVATAVVGVLWSIIEKKLNGSNTTESV